MIGQAVKCVSGTSAVSEIFLQTYYYLALLLHSAKVDYLRYKRLNLVKK